MVHILYKTINNFHFSVKILSKHIVVIIHQAQAAGKDLGFWDDILSKLKACSAGFHQLPLTRNFDTTKKW